MAQIIAGYLQLQEDAEQARAALRAAGFPEERISAFYVNQPGQHDVYPIGGDREESPGAKETPEGVSKGMAAGGAIGAAIGAVTAVVTGPAGPVVGALVGAHVGSLYSLNSMKGRGEAEEGGENQERVRRAGMLVAVALADESERAGAIAALRGVGAERIEQAEGTISGGDWSDFDPLAPPQPVH